MIVARDSETQLLNTLCKENSACFLAVYGRRRIGKTYLIHEFFSKNSDLFEVTGIKNGTIRDQINSFVDAFCEVFGEGSLTEKPSSWRAAFELLWTQIKNRNSKKKITIFLDELPWLTTSRSNLLETIDYFWNRYFSRRNDIILIVCGSAASWMINKIINNKAGLHNRTTHTLHLKKFTLIQTQKYLSYKEIVWTPMNVLECYLTFGGVAKYLSYIEKGKSPAQSIQNICFSKNAQLINEQKNLLTSLFDNSHIHVQIVEILSKHYYGLNQNELSKQLKITSGGTFTNILNELSASGLITAIKLPRKKTNGLIYRLTDEFCVFSQKWMSVSLHTLQQDPNYWLKKRSLQSWSIWMGYAFENFCVENAFEITKALEISGLSNQIYTVMNKSDNKNYQLDLVIDRPDRCIHLCEVKYSETPFVVTKKYADHMQQIKNSFILQTKTKKQVFLTLITPQGISANSYSGIFDQVVDLKKLIKD